MLRPYYPIRTLLWLLLSSCSGCLSVGNFVTDVRPLQNGGIEVTTCPLKEYNTWVFLGTFVRLDEEGCQTEKKYPAPKAQPSL